MEGWMGRRWLGKQRMRPDMEDNLVQRRQEPWAQLWKQVTLVPKDVSSNASGILRIWHYSSLKFHLQIILVSHLSGTIKSVTQWCAEAAPFCSPELTVHLSSQFHIQWHSLGSLKLVMVGVFTPEKLETYILGPFYWGGCFPLCVFVFKPTYRWVNGGSEKFNYCPKSTNLVGSIFDPGAPNCVPLTTVLSYFCRWEKCVWKKFVNRLSLINIHY